MHSADYAVFGTMYVKQVITDSPPTITVFSFIDNTQQIQTLGYYILSKNKNYIDIAFNYNDSSLDTSASKITFNLTCIDNY